MKRKHSSNNADGKIDLKRQATTNLDSSSNKPSPKIQVVDNHDSPYKPKGGMNRRASSFFKVVPGSEEKEIQDVVQAISGENADLKVLEMDQEINREKFRSPIKVFFSSPIKIEVPENTVLYGVTAKRMYNHGIAKQCDIDILEEVIGGKIIEPLLANITGSMGLAPENAIVVMSNKDVLLYSKYLTGHYKTLLSVIKEKANNAEEFKNYPDILQNSIDEKLWAEFLQYFFLSTVMYRNADLHNRNIGIVEHDGKQYIAAVDFGRLFYIKVSQDANVELNTCLHLLHHLHWVDNLTGSDVKLLIECLSRASSNRDGHLEDLQRSLDRMGQFIKDLKRTCDVSIEETIPGKVLMEYIPNSTQQNNPLHFIKHDTARGAFKANNSSCAKSFEKYSQTVLRMFNAGCDNLIGIAELLAPYKEGGLNIKTHLSQQGIDVDCFKKAAEAKKLAFLEVQEKTEEFLEKTPVFTQEKGPQKTQSVSRTLVF